MPETPSISHAARAAMLAMTSLATRTAPNDPLLPIQGMLPLGAALPLGLGPLHIGLGPRVNSDEITCLDEQRDLDHRTGFELGRLRGAGNNVALKARVGLHDSHFDVDWQLDPDELALLTEQIGRAPLLEHW